MSEQASSLRSVAPVLFVREGAPRVDFAADVGHIGGDGLVLLVDAGEPPAFVEDEFPLTGGLCAGLEDRREELGAAAAGTNVAGRLAVFERPVPRRLRVRRLEDRRFEESNVRSLGDPAAPPLPRMSLLRPTATTSESSQFGAGVPTSNVAAQPRVGRRSAPHSTPPLVRTVSTRRAARGGRRAPPERFLRRRRSARAGASLVRRGGTQRRRSRAPSSRHG